MIRTKFVQIWYEVRSEILSDSYKSLGLIKIMIKKKSKQSDLFDLNQIFM